MLVRVVAIAVALSFRMRGRRSRCIWSLDHRTIASVSHVPDGMTAGNAGSGDRRSQDAASAILHLDAGAGRR